MEQNDVNRQSNRPINPIDNFKGKRHQLTREDSVKGGSVSSPRKARANSIKNMKTGKYSKRVPHCHTCLRKKSCASYDPKDPKAACKIIDIPSYLHLMDVVECDTEEEFDMFLNKLIQRLYLKNLTAEDYDIIRGFYHDMLKLRVVKFSKSKDQTINVQINNFHNEFNIFKDTTLKILKKHPAIMKEWREALDSAKRSD